MFEHRERLSGNQVSSEMQVYDATPATKFSAIPPRKFFLRGRFPSVHGVLHRIDRGCTKATGRGLFNDDLARTPPRDAIRRLPLAERLLAG